MAIARANKNSSESSTRSKHKASSSVVTRSRAMTTSEPGWMLQRKAKCACGGNCPNCRQDDETVQTKLTVGAVNDRYEQEADRIAESVVRMPNPAPASSESSISPAAPPVSLASGISPLVQRDATATPSNRQEDVTAGVKTGVRALQGGGTPLPPETREFFEDRFGRDFSQTRVHTDSRAAQLASSLDARALTVGNHIAFAAGELAPETAAGRRLLAHELTHVVQQGGATGVVQRRSSQTEGTPSADSDRALVADFATVSERTNGLTIQRQEDEEGVLDSVAGGLSSFGDQVSEGADQLVDYGRAGVRVVRAGASAAAEAVGGTFAWASELVVGFLSRSAPWILDVLQGGFEFVKTRAIGLLDGLLAGFASAITAPSRVLSFVVPRAMSLVESVSTIASDLASGRCESFFSAASALGGFVERVASPIIEPIQEAVSSVGTVIRQIWDAVGAPALSRASQLGAWLWDNLTALGDRIWNATAGLRGLLGEAWTLYQQHFDKQWDSSVSILGDLWEKAQEVWGWLREQLGPALIPIAIAVGMIAGIVFGPIVGVLISAAGVWEAIRWLRANWGEVESLLVSAREFLNTTILPAIQQGAASAAAALANAHAALLGGLRLANSALAEVLTALSGVPLLGRFVAALSPLILGAVTHVTSLVESVPQALQHARNGLLQLLEFVRPIAVIVAAILVFPTFPWVLPTVLAGWAWRALPDCFKPGIIDFFIDSAIAFVRATPTFSLFGEGWALAKVSIVEALTRVRGQDLESKVAMSNKIARMMTGEDVSWIPTMIRGAVGMTDHFWSEASREFLGTDINEPLEFEVLPTTEAAERPRLIEGGAMGETLTTGLASRISSGNLLEGDIEVEAQPELQLEPELVAEMVRRASEGPIELGEGDNEWRPADLEAEVPADVDTLEPDVGAQETVAPQAEIPGDPDAQLEYLLGQTPSVCGGDQQSQPEPQQSGPVQRRFGPFTSGQRLSYMFGTIGRALSAWFDCNKHWLVPALTVAVAALIVTEILTGGAITGALLEILPVVGAIFIGVSAVRAAGYITNYVAESINGNVAAAAISLARGLAIASIELVSELALPAAGAVVRGASRAVGAVVRGVGGAARATLGATRRVAGAARRGLSRGASAVGRAGAGVTRGLGRLAPGLRRFARPVIRNGRVFIRAVDDTITRGARSIRSFYQRLRQQLRDFASFFITFRRRRFFLWGRFNPPVLLATGRVEDVDVVGVQPRAGLGVELVGGPRTAGIVLGDDIAGAAASAVRRLNPSSRRALFRRLDALSDAERVAEIRRLASGELAPHVRRLLRGVDDATALRIADEALTDRPRFEYKLGRVFERATTEATEARRAVDSAATTLASRRPGVYGRPDNIQVTASGLIREVEEVKFLARRSLEDLATLARTDPNTFVRRGLGQGRHIQIQQHRNTIEAIANNPALRQGVVTGVSQNVRYVVTLPRFAGGDLTAVRAAVRQMKAAWRSQLGIDVIVRYGSHSTSDVVAAARALEDLI